MTAGGVIPPHDLVCVCGQPIEPCPVPLNPSVRWMCAGYVHRDFKDGRRDFKDGRRDFKHGCRTRDGVAEPAGAAVPP